VEKWADAWLNKKPFKADRVGIAYMLGGETLPGGASNIDPYATAPTADNQWVSEGPHIMVLVPETRSWKASPPTPTMAAPM